MAWGHGGYLALHCEDVKPTAGLRPNWPGCCGPCRKGPLLDIQDRPIQKNYRPLGEPISQIGLMLQHQ